MQLCLTTALENEYILLLHFINEKTDTSTSKKVSFSKEPVGIKDTITLTFQCDNISPGFGACI